MTYSEKDLKKINHTKIGVFALAASMAVALGVTAIDAGIKYVQERNHITNVEHLVKPTHHMDRYVQGNHSYYVFDDKIAGEVCVKTSKSPLGLIEEGVRIPLNRTGYDNEMLTDLVSQLNYDTSCEHIQPGQVYLGLRPASQNLGSITNNPKLETRAIPKTHNYN